MSLACHSNLFSGGLDLSGVAFRNFPGGFRAWQKNNGMTATIGEAGTTHEAAFWLHAPGTNGTPTLETSGYVNRNGKTVVYISFLDGYETEFNCVNGKVEKRGPHALFIDAQCDRLLLGQNFRIANGALDVSKASFTWYAPRKATADQVFGGAKYGRRPYIIPQHTFSGGEGGPPYAGDIPLAEHEGGGARACADDWRYNPKKGTSADRIADVMEKYERAERDGHEGTHYFGESDWIAYREDQMMNRLALDEMDGGAPDAPSYMVYGIVDANHILVWKATQSSPEHFSWNALFTALRRENPYWTNAPACGGTEENPSKTGNSLLDLAHWRNGTLSDRMAIGAGGKPSGVPAGDDTWVEAFEGCAFDLRLYCRTYDWTAKSVTSQGHVDTYLAGGYFNTLVFATSRMLLPVPPA